MSLMVAARVAGPPGTKVTGLVVPLAEEGCSGGAGDLLEHGVGELLDLRG